jgi:hypothetical protein
MLVTRKKYDAETAAKDAEIAQAREGRNAWFGQWHRANAQCAAHEHTIARLEAPLAKFTAPRARDGAGRFLPLPAGDMGEVRV